MGDAEDLSGRRMINAYAQLNERFLLMYGDNYWPLEWSQMLACLARHPSEIQMTLFKNQQGTGEYGPLNNTLVDTNGNVISYQSKEKSADLNGLDIGFFIVNKQVIDPSVKENISFQETVLKKQVSMGTVRAYMTDEQYFYITDQVSLQNFCSTAVARNFKALEDRI